MHNFEDNIRAFGMSGFLASDDLRNIERSFGIELGHVPTLLAEQQTDYYPQFEQSVREEAARMSVYYEMFYCLEASIRKLISEVLQESDGANWWEGGRIPQSIATEVKGRQQKELDNGFTRRSERAIDYTTFGELSNIITTNWDLFGAIFSSRRAVERVMSNLNVLRGPIAHSCPMSDDEVDRLRLAVKDWFRMLS